MSATVRRTALLLLVVEMGGIAWLVLNPSPATPTGAVYRISAFLTEHGAPSWVASATGWEYLLNVALFLPLGLLSSLVWERVSVEAWVVAGFAVSAILELVQLLVLGERSATLSDLSANTVGTFAGALLAALVVGAARRRARDEKRTLDYDEESIVRHSADAG